MNVANLRLLLVALFVAASICVLAGCKETPRNTILQGTEAVRVTSPNGRLDAILIREDGGGAAGGWEWYVYIVAKGESVDEKNAHPVFNAGTLRGEKLVWAEEHLLEIQDDIAYINQFRNIWGSSEIHGDNAADGEYLIEIRLVPSSPDFSLLNQNGEFKRKK